MLLPIERDKVFVGAGVRGHVFPAGRYRGAVAGPDSVGLAELGLLPLSGVPTAEAAGTRTKIQARLY